MNIRDGISKVTGIFTGKAGKAKAKQKESSQEIKDSVQISRGKGSAPKPPATGKGSAPAKPPKPPVSGGKGSAPKPPATGKGSAPAKPPKPPVSGGKGSAPKPPATGKGSAIRSKGISDMNDGYLTNDAVLGALKDWKQTIK